MYLGRYFYKVRLSQLENAQFNLAGFFVRVLVCHYFIIPLLAPEPTRSAQNKRSNEMSKMYLPHTDNLACCTVAVLLQDIIKVNRS